MNMYNNPMLAVAQPQVPPLLVTLPLECPRKPETPQNLNKVQLSTLGVNTKLARPSKGLPIRRVSPGISIRF